MSWIQTSSGMRFYPQNPEKSTFKIQDIAHALSQLCRFGGHTMHFYSVAQHSVLVAEIVESLGGSKSDQLWGLMHDATEAYMIDLPTPIKALFPEYKVMEKALMKVLQKRFGLADCGDLEMPAIVKEADAIALRTEAGQLIFGGCADWKITQTHQPYNTDIFALSPMLAQRSFMSRWDDLSSLGEN